MVVLQGDGVRVIRGDSGLGEGDEVRLSQEELRGTWAAGGQTWSSSDSSDGRPQLLRPSPPHSSTLRCSSASVLHACTLPSYYVFGYFKTQYQNF